MKGIMKLIIIGLAVITLLLGIFLFATSYYFGSTGKEKEDIVVIIPSGSSFSDIASILKEEKLIKNEKMFLLYLKLNKVDNIYAATYYLNHTMNVKQIVKSLIAGGHNADEISVTFKEGLNVRGLAKVISDKTNNKYDDVLKMVNDDDYIKELVEKFWFLTDEINNKNIYYSLEGYLYPETYRFNSKDVTVKEIFNKMLKQTDEILSKYKAKLESSGYSVHQILTLASIIELEGINSDDRPKVASVFYNRLNAKWALGSDVTTYYGAKIELSDRDLKQSELDANNGYNTRNSSMAGKLPVGPICNPGLSSIEAALNPPKTNYYYFVADKNNKVYFTKTAKEHDTVISELKSKGLWYEW